MNDIVLTEEDIDIVSSEEYSKAEEKVEKIIDVLNSFEDELDEHLQELNSLEAYKQLGMEIHIEHQFTIEHTERNDEN